MSRRRRDRSTERPRRSPDATVADATDAAMAELGIPELPRGLPQRLEHALTRRIEALLYRLEQSVGRRHLRPLEVRLARDAHRAVLAGHELGVKDSEVHYARLRAVLAELGYERCEVGYRLDEDD